MSEESLPEEYPELAYWKAAISQLPSNEMRDAAWEFFMRHLAQNPKMADTFSGMILVMQANGMYMLTVPEIVHEKAIKPFHDEIDEFRCGLAEHLERHQHLAAEILTAARATEAGAQAAGSSVKQFETAIATVWKEIDTKALSGKIHADLEEIIFKPFHVRCRELEALTSLAQEASLKVERSIEKFRRIHFGGIVVTMAAACMVVMGGLFGYGWRKLSDHYDRSLVQALKRVQWIEAENQEAFLKLNQLGAAIAVVPVGGDNGKPIPGKYALTLMNADDTVLQDLKEGRRGAILFYAPRR